MAVCGSQLEPVKTLKTGRFLGGERKKEVLSATSRLRDQTILYLQLTHQLSGAFDAAVVG